MTSEFSQFNLRPQLEQAIAGQGYESPMPIQTAVIPVMIAGHDVIGQAQTGTGKTAAFALPILNNLQPNQDHVQSLVLAPTRELALQVAEAFNVYGALMNVRVLAVYGGAPYMPQIKQLKRGVDIVVGTPGRLMDLMERKVLNLEQVRTVVLDEADEMLSMGFIEDIQTILAATPAERQTALFSATLPTEIRRLAEHYMREPQSLTIQREHMTVDSIKQRYYLVNQKDKLAALTRLFEIEEITSALIFVRTRAGTAELANALTARGFPSEALNGDLSQDAREHTLNRFRQGKITVLAATDVAARGLDIDHISHVINFDLPDDPELYVHRIGRTGRAGKTGIAITLLTPVETRHLRQIEAYTHSKLEKGTLPTEDDILNHRETQLVNEINKWLQRGRCRRERELVESMVEQGHDPLMVAAVALKLARAEEKQRPIAPISEVVERQFSNRNVRDTRSRGGRERVQTWSATSHEEGMVRLSLAIGKKHGVRPNDIVGAIAAHANIPGSLIGKIHIQEKLSYVDIPEEVMGQVMNAKDLFIRKFPVQPQQLN
jgi:ATP-dependent RNA helicase DeaD